MRGLIGFLRAFRRDEHASATIEFALFAPLMIALMLSSLELGMLLTRRVMLERGLDIAVRQVRIGAMTPVTHEALVEAVCDAAFMIPDCRNQLRLEMVLRNPRSWVGLNRASDCINREDPSQPPREFQPGMQNQLVVLRACSLFDPLFPTAGLGSQLQRVSGGAYAIVATTAYVVEPRR